MSQRWYVVQSKQKQEYEAAKQLENQNFVVYIPQMLLKKTVRGKSVQVPTPLFPSYLFVQFDITKDRWRAVCGTRGVQQLVTATDESVTPLPRGLVEDMMLETDDLGYLSVKKADEIIADYRPGDKLEVVDGVFQGLSGTCERVNKDRVFVLLALLSGNTRVELPASMVASVS